MSSWSDLNQIDRVVHEPARLIILGILTAAGCTDFTFLMREANLSKGNLSSHLTKLEEAGYVSIEKTARGRIPLTLVHMTSAGRTALKNYRMRMLRVLTPVAPSRSTA